MKTTQCKKNYSYEWGLSIDHKKSFNKQFVVNRNNVVHRRLSF